MSSTLFDQVSSPSLFVARKYFTLRGSRQSFEADHGILQNAQVRRSLLPLNVNDAILGEPTRFSVIVVAAAVALETRSK